eukprot:scaffold143503_cov265-Phaeocystis_antarctica.AAC.1
MRSWGLHMRHSDSGRVPTRGCWRRSQPPCRSRRCARCRASGAPCTSRSAARGCRLGSARCCRQRRAASGWWPSRT